VCVIEDFSSFYPKTTMTRCLNIPIDVTIVVVRTAIKQAKEIPRGWPMVMK
jgi:hypothetical protein